MRKTANSMLRRIRWRSWNALGGLSVSSVLLIMLIERQQLISLDFGQIGGVLIQLLLAVAVISVFASMFSLGDDDSEHPPGD